MPVGIAPSDRKLLLGAGAVALALMAGTVAFYPAGETEGREVPSSYAAGPGGARAAYLLLAESGYRVRRWEEPPQNLENEAEGALLIVAEPSVMPTEHERRAVVEYVRGGGRLLFCGAALRAFFQEANLEPETGKGAQLQANLPGSLTRNAPRVEIESDVRWGKLSAPQVALYGEAGAAAVVLWPMGRGQVLWWAGATPLTNGGITRAGNLNLFLNAAAGARGEILWDEYFHGERGSLWSYFAKTAIGWGAAQAAIVFLAILFTFGRRSGPVAMPAAVSRLSPLEFVDTMGGLYQRAGAQSVAVEAARRHLRRELARRLGLPATTPDEELARAAGERLGAGSELAATLAESAEQGSPTPAATLKLVQRLRGYDARLNDARRTAKEKS